MDFYLASKTPRDIELGRDYALTGQQFRGPLTEAQAAEKLAEMTAKGWTARVVSSDQLKNWKPRKQRLDAYLEA